MTADLVAFLRQQYDADERVARAASAAPWRRDYHGAFMHAVSDATGRHLFGQGHLGETQDVQHIVRWDPATVLAEVDAKRRILDLHVHDPAAPWGSAEVTDVGCVVCHWRQDDLIGFGWCQTVRLLALRFADRDGYDEAWKPAP